MMGLSPLLRSFRVRGAYALLKRLEANMSLAWLGHYFTYPKP